MQMLNCSLINVKIVYFNIVVCSFLAMWVVGKCRSGVNWVCGYWTMIHGFKSQVRKILYLQNLVFRIRSTLPFSVLLWKIVHRPISNNFKRFEACKNDKLLWNDHEFIYPGLGKVENSRTWFFEWGLPFDWLFCSAEQSVLDILPSILAIYLDVLKLVETTNCREVQNFEVKLYETLTNNLYATWLLLLVFLYLRTIKHEKAHQSGFTRANLFLDG